MKTKGFVMLLAAALALAACDNNGGGGGGGEVTVSFESNGGGAVASVTVAYGATIAVPAAPSYSFSGANSRFRGWYTDNGTFKAPYDFSGRVLGDITLYADWGFRPGDTGPGSGTIFYRADAGFTMTDNSQTAYYLEAAPQDEGVLTWGPPGQGGGGGLPNNVATAGYSTAIGGGRKNTAVILLPDMVPNSPAALACDGAAHGGQTDWFLPSRGELDQLFLQRALVPNLKTSGDQGITWYWTSNQYDDEFVYAKNFSVGTNNTNQNIAFNVRAVRAF